MGEMVERVARAICFSRGGAMLTGGQSVATREFGWDIDHDYMAKYVEAHWKEHIHAAGYAIAAMREPQVDGVSNVYSAFDRAEPDGVMGPKGLIAIWQSMIDEALK